VRVSLTNQQRIVILKEINKELYLPIWIGAYEAEAITIALQEVEIARPQTHDLIKNVIHTLNARLVRIEITSLKDDVYFANLVLESNGEEVRIDSRPSDAVAMAIRCHVSILVGKEVMDAAAIKPEKEEPVASQTAEKSIEDVGEPSQSSSDRLSIFKDFIDQLDAHDAGKSTRSDEDKPKPRKPKKA
ncbi:MAG: bifunctional nuclease family protein, partial [Anaerolineaceae bacterium]